MDFGCGVRTRLFGRSSKRQLPYRIASIWDRSSQCMFRYRGGSFSGQQRCVMLPACLLLSPVILLDEPTSALDQSQLENPEETLYSWKTNIPYTFGPLSASAAWASRDFWKNRLLPLVETWLELMKPRRFSPQRDRDYVLVRDYWKESYA